MRRPPQRLNQPTTYKGAIQAGRCVYRIGYRDCLNMYRVVCHHARHGSVPGVPCPRPSNLLSERVPTGSCDHTPCALLNTVLAHFGSIDVIPVLIRTDVYAPAHFCRPLDRHRTVLSGGPRLHDPQSRDKSASAVSTLPHRSTSDTSAHNAIGAKHSRSMHPSDHQMGGLSGTYGRPSHSDRSRASCRSCLHHLQVAHTQDGRSRGRRG